MDTDRYTVTRSGLRIGCAYQAPPPSVGSEAEAIQSALLRTRRIQAPAANEPSHAPITNIGHRVVFAVCVAILVAFFAALLKS